MRQELNHSINLKSVISVGRSDEKKAREDAQGCVSKVRFAIIKYEPDEMLDSPGPMALN
jgi:hypothetical protein